MSFIYRDSLSPSRAKQQGRLALYRLFDNVWGKSTVDGIEVYDEKLYWYQGSVRTDKPFLRFMGKFNQSLAKLQAHDFSQVNAVYFQLNTGKVAYVPQLLPEIAQKINGTFSVGDTVELFIHYGGETRRIVDSHWDTSGSEPIVDTEAIVAELFSNPQKYFANNYLGSVGTQYSSSVPYTWTSTLANAKITPATRVEYNEDTTSILATLALLDNGSVFSQVGSVYDSIVSTTVMSDGSLTYELSFKVKYQKVATCTTSSYLATEIKKLMDAISYSLGLKNGNVYARSNQVSDTTLKQAVIAMNVAGEIEGLTYAGRLRVDAVANMKKSEFVSILGNIMETGYDKKKTKWYQKALGILIIIAGIYLMIKTAGVGSKEGMSLASVGLAMLYGSAYFTMGMLVYARIAPSATDMVKIIGQFATVTGIAGAILGGYAAIQQSFKQYATQAATDATIAAYESGVVSSEELMKVYVESEAKYTVSQYLVDVIGNQAMGMVNKVQSFFTTDFWSSTADKFTTSQGLSSITLNDVSGGLKNLETGLELYQKFFNPYKDLPSATDDQAKKQDGVESIYTAMDMIDEIDALYKMDYLMQTNEGGKITENFLVQNT